MRHNKLVNIIFIAVLILTGLIWFSFKDLLTCFVWDKYFSDEITILCFEKDLDSDGQKENILVKMRQFYWRHFNGGWLEVKKGEELIWQSKALGDKLEMIRIYDINHDGAPEIVSIWGDGNGEALYIYGFKKDDYKEVFWASGKDNQVADIDQDGLEEIIEYWRDYDKQFDTYYAHVYHWNGKEYVIWKQSIPVIIDPVRGDRLDLGRGKIAVLK